MNKEFHILLQKYGIPYYLDGLTTVIVMNEDRGIIMRKLKNILMELKTRMF